MYQKIITRLIEYERNGSGRKSYHGKTQGKGLPYASLYGDILLFFFHYTKAVNQYISALCHNLHLYSFSVCRCQALIWTDDHLTAGNNFDNGIKMQQFLTTKWHLNMLPTQSHHFVFRFQFD